MVSLRVINCDIVGLSETEAAPLKYNQVHLTLFVILNQLRLTVDSMAQCHEHPATQTHHNFTHKQHCFLLLAHLIQHISS